jgi:uncharacterized protein (TIGR03435 family)
MRRNQRKFGSFLDRSFARFRGLSAPPDDPSWERILERLEEEPEAASDLVRPKQSAVSRPRIGFRFAVAAVLILTVAIGVYAFRAQRESAAPVVPSIAQGPAPSVKGEAETTQVPGITPESTKPAVAPPKEGILRGVAAQIAAAQSTDAGAARPRFGAASVRPLPSLLDQAGNRVPGVPTRKITLIKCLGVDGQLWVPFYAQDPTPPRRGRCTGQAVPVDMLVVTAYASSPLVRLVGFSLNTPSGPSLVQIEAVAENPDRVTKAELQQMLRVMLEDRFKARVHFETRELDGYVLTIAKSGIKFKEIPGEATPAACGRPNPWSASGPCTMQMVVKRLVDAVRVPIDDKTGLTGTYDIDFRLEDPLLAANAPGVRGGGGQQDQPLPFNPPVPKAVENQLGLHLEPAKLQVEFIVIDNLELPAEN